MKMISTRRGAGLRGVCLLLLFVLILAGVTGWFVVRTDGFRQLAAERLSRWSGLPIEVEAAEIGWPYVLVLRGVATAAEAEASPVRLWIRELRIGRSWRFWRVQVHSGMLQMPADASTRTADEVPAKVVRLAQLRDAGAMDIMRVTANMRRHVALLLQDVDLIWADAEGTVVGRVPQLHFQMEPVDLPSGRMVYYELAVPGQADGALGHVRNLRWEWLSRRQDHYVEIMRRGTFDDDLSVQE